MKARARYRQLAGQMRGIALLQGEDSTKRIAPDARTQPRSLTVVAARTLGGLEQAAQYRRALSSQPKSKFPGVPQIATY